MVDVIDIDEVCEFTLGQLRLWREVSPVARFGRQPYEEFPEPVSVMSLDRPDVQKPAARSTSGSRALRLECSAAARISATLSWAMVWVRWGCIVSSRRSGAGLEHQVQRCFRGPANGAEAAREHHLAQTGFPGLRAQPSAARLRERAGCADSHCRRHAVRA